MEKRSPLFYIGLLLQILFVLIGFGTGTLAINNFIVHSDSISLTTKYLVVFLGALAFIISYFVGAFAYPDPAKKFSFLIWFIWGVLMITIILVFILNLEQPIAQFLNAIQVYSFAGLILAHASNRLRTVIKT